VRKPNDIKKPNPTPTKIVGRLPLPVPGTGSVFRYTDGTMHRIVVRTKHIIDASGKDVMAKIADHCKRVTQRRHVVKKTLRKHQREEATKLAAAKFNPIQSVSHHQSGDTQCPSD
jgi:hypothetical protein